MPETDTSAAETESTTEQQSATDEGSTDWKAKAREWEKRAKENMTRLKEAEPKIAEYDRLVQASKSELDVAREQASQYQERMQQAERAALVSSVALDKGLPANLARRLQGETQAELEADADELLSQFPQQQQTREARAPRADLSQGSSARGGTAATPADELAAILQKSIRP